ncbi:fungal-specific transcription factor domain-containing protein [Tricladium varicosporioides]|nr:fungal-specific transcription factor domain-containing protein [Hymenoscyphus varicosporioides]
MALPHLVHDPPIGVLQRLDPIEVEILQSRGAFDLPPKESQDQLVDLFFRWVAPILPIINQKDFLERYHNAANPPSLLLLQSIFLSVERIFLKIQSNINYDASTTTFLRRAKALYDAGYEQDPVIIVQSLILMSWYWHGPHDVTENGLFYWSRLAIAVAQDNNMHRSNELPHLSLLERHLWKRIWWTLFTRDRAVGAAYGRPVSIILEHSSVDELTEDDFIDYDGHSPNLKHVQFFIHYVKLSKVLEMVACKSTRKREYCTIRAECEFELNKWLLNCPEEMHWQQSNHEFWAAVLHYTYNTILCQLYGLQSIKLNPTFSQIVASEAASTIISTIECLVSHNEIKYAPPSVLYSVLTVLVTVKNQLSSSVPSLVLQSKRKAKTCILLLSALSYTWPIARVLSEISELIFSEKRFHEMLESASNGPKMEARNEITTSRRIFKRSSLNSKQARQEFMLPRSRVILRMDLTNHLSHKDLPRNKLPPQSEEPSPLPRDPLVVCDSITRSTTDGLEPDIPLPIPNTFSSCRMEAPGLFTTCHRGIWEPKEHCIGEATIFPLEWES